MRLSLYLLCISGKSFQMGHHISISMILSAYSLDMSKMDDCQLPSLNEHLYLLDEVGKYFRILPSIAEHGAYFIIAACSHCQRGIRASTCSSDSSRRKAVMGLINHASFVVNSAWIKLSDKKLCIYNYVVPFSWHSFRIQKLFLLAPFKVTFRYAIKLIGFYLNCFNLG